MKKFRWLIISVFVIFGAVAGLCATHNFPMQVIVESLETQATVSNISHALDEFRERYHALPGDLRDASKVIKGCTETCNPSAETAGDGIIGRPDFIKTLLPQVADKVKIPATSAEDETVLFWTHLAKAGLLDSGGMPDKDGIPVGWGRPYPRSSFGDSGFIVGYSDGSPLPPSLAPDSKQSPKGVILVLISSEVLEGEAKMNDPGQQPMKPRWAAMADRRMDDGRPDSGYIQAYGPPSCFKTSDYYNSGPGLAYNEDNPSNDCGLIYRIEWDKR
ncbi:MAG: hypothetical protein ACAH80_11645 [Alphaproteobacteria bacterium]